MIIPDLSTYARVLVMFSGGKDSLACVLHLLELGVPRNRIELWHHEIDGREGSALMDWSVTPDYCRAVAETLGIRIYYSWLEGGFEREMTKDGQRKAATLWENPDGTLGRAGGERGKVSTRRKFPQITADLRTRWCSAYLKIDVAATAIRGQARFNGCRTLVITGERAEESPGRAKYLPFEPDRADNRNGRKRRHVDRWRPVHAWAEAAVWDIIRRWRINPHPAYKLGFGRCSCQFCIFGSPAQFATARAVSSRRFTRLVKYEREFGVTLRRKEGLEEYAGRGRAYAYDEADAVTARSLQYRGPVQLARGEWQLPLGAFGESTGPT